MRRKRPNRGLKNMHHPGPSIYSEFNGPAVQTTHTDGTGPTISLEFKLKPGDRELILRYREMQRILQRQRRRTMLNKRIAWTIFWAVILATTWVCANALGHTLERVIIALENL